MMKELYVFGLTSSGYPTIGVFLFPIKSDGIHSSSGIRFGRPHHSAFKASSEKICEVLARAANDVSLRSWFSTLSSSSFGVSSLQMTARISEIDRQPCMKIRRYCHNLPKDASSSTNRYSGGDFDTVDPILQETGSWEESS
jgi:hypothetical protein